MYSKLLTLSGLAFGALGWSTNAHADDCGGSLGSSFTSYCDASAATATDTCLVSGTHYTCDANRNYTSGTLYAAYMQAVYDGSGALCGADYCIWGTDANGNDFCCASDGDRGATTLGDVTLVGTTLDDSFYLYNGGYDLENWAGGDFKGVVGAGAGDDYIEGSRHDDPYYTDLLQGDDDDDIILGLAGDDELYGNDGVDDIAGGDGDDVISGGDGNDDLGGNDGDDDIHGNAGDDTIYGDDGVDSLFGDSGEDTISGGLDDDIIYGNSENDTIDGDDGNDYIAGGPGNDDVRGGAHNDTINGDDGYDLLCGDTGDDTLFGHGQDDVLWGGAGTDGANGGAGTDTCDVENPYPGSCETAYTGPGTGPCH